MYIIVHYNKNKIILQIQIFILLVVVVAVDLGTLAKCQCTPLPTRWYNHGEVASTIIELHCNSIAAPLGAGVDCYLT